MNEELYSVDNVLDALRNVMQMLAESKAVKVSDFKCEATRPVREIPSSDGFYEFESGPTVTISLNLQAEFAPVEKR